MCFDADSEPPIPRIAGAAVSHDDLTLTSADGTELAAFLATPDERGGGGRRDPAGRPRLYHFYEELALRFAERGYAGDRDRLLRPHRRRREARRGLRVHAARRPDDRRRRAGGHAAQASTSCASSASARCSPSASASAAVPRGSPRRPAHGLAGAVGFYGGPTRERGGASPVARAAQIECPILALQAGADPNITAEDNAAFDEALTGAGVEHEIVEYEGAPHSFFDRKQEEFQADSDDAWRRTLEFIAAHA